MSGRIIRTDNMSLAAEIVRLHGDVGNLLDSLETQMEINTALLHRIYAIEEKLNGLTNNAEGTVRAPAEPAAPPPDRAAGYPYD